MSGRLLVAIISTVAEEAAILIVGVWLLPRAGIRIPVLLVIGLMLAWLGWSVFVYRKGSGALVKRPVNGLVSMKGMRGTVIADLKPDGLVKIRGEIWRGRAISGRIKAGSEVVVIGQEGLMLVVGTGGYSPAPSSVVDDGYSNEDDAGNSQDQAEDFQRPEKIGD